MPENRLSRGSEGNSFTLRASISDAERALKQDRRPEQGRWLDWMRRTEEPGHNPGADQQRLTAVPHVPSYLITHSKRLKAAAKYGRRPVSRAKNLAAGLPGRVQGHGTNNPLRRAGRNNGYED